MNMREEFEKWLTNCLGPFVDMSRDVDDGVYEWQDVRLAWLAWKAAQPEWIERAEHTPVDSKWYVVSTYYGYYIQCWSDGQGWLGDDVSIADGDVTHLIPLPTPPEA
ncbi:hypothetical protein [Edwardsiella phage GF-2]|uniref:Uncharacterized protein n=1 Tax=Edwardsiella phage GF-2 TaxID=1537091 RepID=A0A077K9X7_9CAUD|nr:hypothetical protein VC56_gp65 [Edwardsiella phage GF-2]BAP28936.1 hypothetical protein [Edwardsiella phage GF-2]